MKYSATDTEITRLQGKSVRAAVQLRRVQILPLGRIRGMTSCKLWEIIQNKLVYPSCSHVYNNLTIIIFFFQSFKIFPRWAVQVQPRRRARPFLSDVSTDSGSSGAEGKRSRQSANQNPCEEQEAERTSEMRRSSSKNEPWSD